MPGAAGAPRRFGLTIALNLVPVLLLLAIGEATVRLMSQHTPRGLVFAKTVLLPHSWRDVAARNEAVLARLEPRARTWRRTDSSAGCSAPIAGAPTACT